VLCEHAIRRLIDGEDMVASAWFRGAASPTLDVLWRLWLSTLCKKAIGLVFIIIA
jgi:hypothetical protein